MEDDSGRVTRSRRRLSVEQDIKHEDSPMNTPTKKRTGRLSIKPHLDNIVENEATPIQSPRRGGRKSVVPVTEPPPVEQDSADAVAHSKSAAASVLDSPKPGKRVTRRTSVTGNEVETAAPLTPLRRSRRISIEYNNVAEETAAETKKSKTAKNLKEIEPLIEENEKENTHNNTTLNNSVSKNKARLSEIISQKLEVAGRENLIDVSSNIKKLSLSKSAVKDQENAQNSKEAVNTINSTKNLASRRMSSSPSEKEENSPKSDDSPSRRSLRISAKNKRNDESSSSEFATTPNSSGEKGKTTFDEKLVMDLQGENKPSKKSRTRSTSSVNNSSSEIAMQNTQETFNNQISDSYLKKAIIGYPGPRVSLEKLPLDSLKTSPMKEANLSFRENDSSTLGKLQRLKDNISKTVDYEDDRHNKSVPIKSMNISEPEITFKNFKNTADKKSKESLNNSDGKTGTSFNNTETFKARKSINISGMVESRKSFNKSNDSNHSQSNEKINRSESKYGEFVTESEIKIEKSSRKSVDVETKISLKESESSNKTLNSPIFGMVEVKDKIESVIYMEVDDDIPEEICTKSNNESLCQKSTDLTQNSSKVKVDINICSEKNDQAQSKTVEKVNDSVYLLNSYREIKYSNKDRSDSKLNTSKSMNRSILPNDSDQNMSIEDPNNVSATMDKQRTTLKLHKTPEVSKSLQDFNSHVKASKRNTSFEELSQSTPTRIKQLKQLGLHTSTPIPSLRPLATDNKCSSKSKVDISNHESEHGNSDSDAISNKLYIDDEAEDAGKDYESGDSLDEDEAERMKDGEIRHKGETLGSDTEEDSSDSEYEKDSFIVTTDEEDDELLSGDEDDLSLTAKELTQSAKSKKIYNKKKNEEQKKASREMYAARHSKDNESRSKLESDSDTEIVMKKTTNKRNRIESEGNEEAEITCPNDSSNKFSQDPLAASILVKTEPNSSYVKDVSISIPDKSDKIDTELTSNLYDETEDLSTDEESQKIIDTYESLLSNLNKTSSDRKKSANDIDTSQDICAPKKNNSSVTKNVLIAGKTLNDISGTHEIEEVQINENKSMFVNIDISRDPFSNTIIKNQDVKEDECQDLADDEDSHKVDLQKYPSITNTFANSGSLLKDRSRNSSLSITEVTSKRHPSLSGSFNKSDKWASISVTDAEENYENVAPSPDSNITSMDCDEAILSKSSLDASLSKKNKIGNEDLRAGDTSMKNDDPDMSVVIESVKMINKDESFTSVTPNNPSVEKADLNEASTYANQSSNSDTSMCYESRRSFKNALDSVRKTKKYDSDVSNSISHVSLNICNNSIPPVIGDSCITKDSPKVNESILSSSNSESGKKKKKKNVSFSLESNDPEVIDYVHEVKVSTNDCNDSSVNHFVNGDTSLVNESVLPNADSAKNKKKNNSFCLSANNLVIENNTEDAVLSILLNVSGSNNTKNSTVEPSINTNDITINSKGTDISTSSSKSTNRKKKRRVSVSVDENISVDELIHFNSPSNASASKDSNNLFIETLVNNNESINNLNSTIMNKNRKSFGSKVLITENSNEAAVPTSSFIVSSKKSHLNESAKSDTYDEEFDAVKKQLKQTSYLVENDVKNEKVSTETTTGLVSSKKKNKKNRYLGSDSCEKLMDEVNTSVAGIFNVTPNSTHKSPNYDCSAKKKKNQMDFSPKLNMSEIPDSMEIDDGTQFGAIEQSSSNSFITSTHKFNFMKKSDWTTPETLDGPFLTSTEKKKKLKKMQLDSSLFTETDKGKEDSVVLFPEVKMSDVSNHSDREVATSQSKKKKKVKSGNLSLFNVSGPLQTTDSLKSVAEFLAAEDVDKSASPCYSESLSEIKQKKKKKKKREREHENKELQSSESQETPDVFSTEMKETSHRKKKMKFTKSVKDSGVEELIEDKQSMRGKKRKATDEPTKETLKTDKKENCGIRRLPATIIEQLNPPSKKSRTDFAVEVTSKRKAKPSTHLDQSILVNRSPTCVGKTGQFVTVKKNKILPSLPLVSASNFGATTQFNIVPLLKRPKNELRMDNLQFHMGSNFKEETLAKRQRTNMKELCRLQRSQFARGRIIRK